MPETLIAIALGGAIGGVARHALATAVQKLARSDFPWGTLSVNFTGSLAIGMLAAFMGVTDSGIVTGAAELMLITGLLGSFTTVSAFSLQTLALYREGKQCQAAINILASTVLCLTGAWVGVAVIT